MRWAVMIFIASLICAATVLDVQAEVRACRFHNQDNCLELSNESTRIVIVPANGGRIVHYSRDDGPNFFAGGCQIDIGPELDYPPKHQQLWAGPYAAKVLGLLSVRLTSPAHEATGVQLVKVITLDQSGAGVRLCQTMKNVGTKEIAYCHWDRTMTNATHAFFKLNPSSRFPARWSMRRGQHGTYSYDGTSPHSPRVKILNDLLITVPGKKMEKVAADNVAGWMAGYREGWLYVKRFPVYAHGDYADGGNSVEIWVNAAGTRTEIEPLSPKVKLQPGESYSFTERWDLRRVEEQINTHHDIPKLVSSVKRMALEPSDPVSP